MITKLETKDNALYLHIAEEYGYEEDETIAFYQDGDILIANHYQDCDGDNEINIFLSIPIEQVHDEDGCVSEAAIEHLMVALDNLMGDVYGYEFDTYETFDVDVDHHLFLLMTRPDDPKNLCDKIDIQAIVNTINTALV